MPRFAANLTWLWSDMPLLERFGAAKSAGFDAVEVLFPYDVPAPEIVERLAINDLKMVLINCPPPNYTERPKGFAAIAGGEGYFKQDFKRALRVAKSLKAEHLHIMAGVAVGEAARAAFVSNLHWAVQEAPEQSLTIEPINHVDMPGYFLDDYDLAMDVLEEVGAPNLGLQFDLYHAHRLTGNVMETWARCRDRVVHVQVAGYPGRHEPEGGEIDHAGFFAALEADGYDGWIAAEYQPKGRVEEGLGWRETLLT